VEVCWCQGEVGQSSTSHEEPVGAIVLFMYPHSQHIYFSSPSISGVTSVLSRTRMREHIGGLSRKREPSGECYVG